MKIQKQPNRASCVATSFAMVMDVPVEYIFKQIKHDGTERMFLKHKPPTCFRGIHPQECLRVAHELGIIFTTHEFESWGGPDQEEHYIINVHWKWGVILESKGVLFGAVATGERHCVAWNGEEQLVYNPNGTTHPLNGFVIEEYYRLIE